MNYQRWKNLNLTSQMANIGSEVERAMSWKEKGNLAYAQRAFERALVLLELTIKTSSGPRRGELTRVREVLLDFFVGSNEFHSTNDSWHKYFYAFTFAARRRV